MQPIAIFDQQKAVSRTRLKPRIAMEGDMCASHAVAGGEYKGRNPLTGIDRDIFGWLT